MTHHSVPNCAKMQDRQRTSAHFSTPLHHILHFLQDNMEPLRHCAFSLTFLQPLALASLARCMHDGAPPQCGCIRSSYFFLQECVCLYFCLSWKSMAVPSLCFAHTPEFLCPNLNKKQNKTIIQSSKRTEGKGATDVLRRMQATPSPADFSTPSVVPLTRQMVTPGLF